MSMSVFSFFWKAVGRADRKRLSKQTPPEGVCELKDVDYALQGDRMRYADVYVAASRASEKLPTVFDIHGGGWYYGDKELNRIYCLNLAAQGSFRIVNLSYRLAPGAGVVTQLRDVVTALNYFYVNSGKFGIDTYNLFITGDSAGGNLAGLVLNCIGNPVFAEKFGVEVLPRFRAAGFTSAAFTLNNLSKKMIARAYFKPIYAGDAMLPELMDYAENVNGVPTPCCIITGDGDFLRNDSLETAEKLKKAGGTVELIDLKGAKAKLGHVFNVTFPCSDEGKAANEGMLSFFKKFTDKR